MNTAVWFEALLTSWHRSFDHSPQVSSKPGALQFAYLAPLSILPISVTDTVRVMIGELDVTTWVNVSAVAADLRRRGWMAEPIAGPASANGFVNVALPEPSGRTATQLTVAPHIREMMATELMTLASLHDAVRAVFDHALPIASPDTQQRVVVLANEQRVWHRGYA